MKNIYLAGPMTGIPQFNFPVFFEAADALRNAGYEVVSPAEIDNPATKAAALASPDGAPGSGAANGETMGDFLSRDVKIVIDDVDAVVVLPNWHKSKGAKIEAFTAIQFGKPVLDADVLIKTGERIVPSALASIGDELRALCTPQILPYA